MRRRLSLGLIVCAFAGAFAAAQAPNATLVPGDNLVVEGLPPIPASLVESAARYTNFRSATFSSWHPSRREMLIRTRFADTPQVHRVSFPLGARRQLTFFPDRVGDASYQPTTGDAFLFTKDRGGDEFYQIYRYDEGSGAITMVTDGGRSQNGGVVWSTKGDRCAYTSTRRNGRDRDVYVVDPGDRATDRRVLEVDGGGWAVTDWSPDDRQMLVAQYVSVNESYLWLVDVASGEKRLLTPKGADKVSYGQGLFAADGRSVFVTTDRDSEFRRLARIDPASGAHTYYTTAIPWDVEGFDLTRDGRLIAFVTNEGGQSVLRLLDTATGAERPRPELGLGPSVIDGVEWHANGRDLALSVTSARSAFDVYSLDATTGTVDRWTEGETGGVDVRTLPAAENVTWRSFDGRQISGFLYKPPARFTGRRPVIVDIHGGPEGQSRPDFLGRDNYFPDELGVAIVLPNVRGSTGFGKTFVTLDNAERREDSVKDIGALLDWIATRPDLDPSRVMITGGSYGGYMTLAVATHYNDRIRCALDVVGISNFVTFLEHTEAYRRDLRRAEYGDERDPPMREILERISPLTNAAKITRPLFIAQGRNDPRVPYTESEQMVATIRKNGGPVWFLMAQDEGHGFAKKRNQDFLFYATVMFVQEHLL